MTGSISKITALRATMHQESLDAFMLPVADEFLSEYVPPHAMRLAWLTGFTGSAGVLIVTVDEALLFTDGRYTLQAEQQLDGGIFKIMNSAHQSPSEWLAARATLNVGFDPRLHSAQEISGLEKKNIRLQPLAQNPIDGLWMDRPEPSKAHAWFYEDDYAGESSRAKIARISDAIRAVGADYLFISVSENSNWLLNIRGGDVECTPIIQCFALLDVNHHVYLFTDESKFPDALLKRFSNVSLQPIQSTATEFSNLKDKKLLLDKAVTPQCFIDIAIRAGAIIIDKLDPIESAKAVKNITELEHVRRVHREDGAALVTAFYAIMQAYQQGAIDEMQIDTILNQARAARDGFLCLSFPAIVGAGAHGAIIHYRVTPETTRNIADGELLLIDSGGQYLGGTTDVTRTLSVGVPTAEFRTHYTRVLKGHIALASAVFPKGTTGSQLDALARQYLWEIGLDYEHGTGHGVGACLSVHEGPQRIGKRGSSVALEAGMIVSNEPGVYVRGSHGIRIENLVEVVSKPMPNGENFLGFSNLTMVPYERALLDEALLSATEIQWLNAYHQNVYDALSPLVSPEVSVWLQSACSTI